MNKVILAISKVAASKVGKIVIDVAQSIEKKALEPLYDSVVRSMATAERVGNYVKLCIAQSVPDYDIIVAVETQYGLTLTTAEIDYFRDSATIKGLGKYVIATELIKSEFKSKNMEESEAYLVNLMIEIVLCKFYKK
jgi:hypothetical protein